MALWCTLLCRDAWTSCPSLAGSSTTSASVCTSHHIAYVRWGCTGWPQHPQHPQHPGRPEAPTRRWSTTANRLRVAVVYRGMQKALESCWELSRKLSGAPASAGSFSQSARALGTSKRFAAFELNLIEFSLHLTSIATAQLCNSWECRHTIHYQTFQLSSAKTWSRMKLTYFIFN